LSWILLALLTACGATCHDLLVRHLLRSWSLSSRLVMGASAVLAALPALAVAALLGPAPRWGPLLGALLATGSINAVAFWAYGRALARGDLSQVLPLINLSPVVLLASGWLLLGERPSVSATFGVLLVVAGALLLGGGPSGPGGWRGLWRAPGVQPMLLVALLWGVGASVDKLGVRAGGSLLWLGGLHLVVGVPLLLPALAAGEQSALAAERAPRWLGASLRPLPLLVALALLVTATGLAQFEALQRTAVVNVVAIKRLSTLFSAVVGVTVFGEYGGALRLGAAALMLGGAVLVLTGGGS